MASAKALLLPLFYIKKQARTRCLSEKGLIFLITFLSILSLVVIFSNLPAQSRHDGEGVQNPLLMKLYKNNSSLIHKNDIYHQKFLLKKTPKSDDNYFKLLEEANLARDQKNREDDMVDEKPIEDMRKAEFVKKVEKPHVPNPVQDKQDFIKKVS